MISSFFIIGMITALFGLVLAFVAPAGRKLALLIMAGGIILALAMFTALMTQPSSPETQDYGIISSPRRG